MRAYLIQRGEIRVPEVQDKKGVDKLVSFEYMGYSEFEWGALPDSLKRIRSGLAAYSTKDYDVEGFIIEKTKSFCSFKKILG